MQLYQNSPEVNTSEHLITLSQSIQAHTRNVNIIYRPWSTIVLRPPKYYQDYIYLVDRQCQQDLVKSQQKYYLDRLGATRHGGEFEPVFHIIPNWNHHGPAWQQYPQQRLSVPSVSAWSWPKQYFCKWHVCRINDLEKSGCNEGVVSQMKQVEGGTQYRFHHVRRSSTSLFSSTLLNKSRTDA